MHFLWYDEATGVMFEKGVPHSVHLIAFPRGTMGQVRLSMLRVLDSANYEGFVKLPGEVQVAITQTAFYEGLDMKRMHEVFNKGVEAAIKQNLKDE